MSQVLIHPTVGRVVWFYPSANTAEGGFARHADGGGPYAALVAHVWSDHVVNLSVFDAKGTPHSRTSVAMLHDDEQAASSDNAFCMWMPFQKGQAKAQTVSPIGEVNQAQTDMSRAGSAGLCDAAAPAPVDPLHRQHLECGAISEIARHVVAVPNRASEVGKAVKTAIDALLGQPTVETKAYTDGTVVTGTAPLPELSPAQQNATEALILAKGKTAPRITPVDLKANIVSEHYFTAADGVAGEASLKCGHVVVGTKSAPPPALNLLTFCVLVLRNGFTVTGESACASPENFDAEIGRRIARENAEQKIWPLMGYELKSRLAAG